MPACTPQRPETPPSFRRRGLLVAIAAADLAQAQDSGAKSASRNEEDVLVTVRRLIGEAKAQAGRIHIDLPDVAESGNSVPLTMRVESPMTATDHVRVIHLVAERNPRPWVASFRLGPHAGKAQVETQIRLSDTQAVAAYAQMSDGSWWMQRVNVTVIIGACESLAVRY